jgi:hypothetical protein
MSKLLLVAASLVAGGVLVACSAAPAGPTPVASPSEVVPSAAPIESSVPASRPPVSEPPPSTAPSSVPMTVEEQRLLAGIRRGAIDCKPVRDALPPKAVGGIECRSDEPAVAQIGFYLFDGDADMLDAYYARMTSERVALESGGCSNGEGESGYVPDEGMSPYRHGCFINDAGFANYRATLPGYHVYLGILGRSADTRALESFAWRGNQDTPGNPTLWGEPAP